VAAMPYNEIKESENGFGFYFDECEIEFVSDSEYFESLED